MLVDSHCHLDFPDFDGGIEAVIARAREAGVLWMLAICSRLSDFERVLAIAEQFDNVFCSVGVHPHEAANEPDVTAEHLVRLSRHPKVVGLGETGLDYHYENSPRDRQQSSFRIHIEAARACGLPVIVHTREADEDTIQILREEHAKGPFSGVIHCFSTAQSLAEDAVRLGLYISFSGIVTFKGADSIRDTARSIPLDRILVETDAPYLAPVPKRGKRNEPSFVVHTATRMAEIVGMESSAFSATTTDNFFRLFSRAGREASEGTGEVTLCG